MDTINRSHRRLARTALTALAASTLLLLGACSGGDDGTIAVKSSDRRPTTTTTAPTSTTTTAPPETTTTAAPTTTVAPTTTTPPTTVPAGPDPAIRAVDLQNAVLPADACEVDGWAASGPIQLSAGAGSWTDETGDIVAEVFGFDVTGYVDLDGDGREDAVLEVGCSAGGSYGDSIVVPLSYVDGRLELIGGQNIPAAATNPGLLGLDDGYGGIRISRIHDAWMDGTSIFVKEYYDATGEECNACLSGEATVLWRFTGGQWVPTMA